jgi:hypothetical protein
MEKYSIFHIEGGLGKNIAATAVAKCIKKNHPDRKLIVVCSYPEIFLNLPYVDRVYRLGIVPYFYEDYIEEKDSIIFKNDPYFTTDHIHKRYPLIENWCNMYGIKYLGESPEIFFNARELQIGRLMWTREKPIMVIQTNGGPMDDQPYKYSWTRDIPYQTSMGIVEAFKEKYHIIQICRDKAQSIQEIESVFNPLSNMELLSLLLFSEKRVLIDSCLQHASAALGIPSTVLWVGTSPEVFGYKIHNNFKAEIPKGKKLPGSYLFDYSFHGDTLECPFSDFNIFNVSSIINSI